MFNDTKHINVMLRGEVHSTHACFENAVAQAWELYSMGTTSKEIIVWSKYLGRVDWANEAVSMTWAD